MPTLYQEPDTDYDPDNPDDTEDPGTGSMITISDEFGSLALSVDGDDLVVAARKRGATAKPANTTPVIASGGGVEVVAVGGGVKPGSAKGDRSAGDSSGGHVAVTPAGGQGQRAQPVVPAVVPSPVTTRRPNVAIGGVSGAMTARPADKPTHSLHVRDGLPLGNLTLVWMLWRQRG